MSGFFALIVFVDLRLIGPKLLQSHWAVERHCYHAPARYAVSLPWRTSSGKEHCPGLPFILFPCLPVTHDSTTPGPPRTHTHKDQETPVDESTCNIPQLKAHNVAPIQQALSPMATPTTPVVMRLPFVWRSHSTMRAAVWNVPRATAEQLTV